MAGDWSSGSDMRQLRTNRSRDAAILGIASGQRQLIRAEQLVGLGLSRSGITHRRRAGRLFIVLRSVYATHPPPYDRFQRWLAAAYGCGPGSIVSDFPAAALLGMLERPPQSVHVTNSSGAGRGLRGVVVHRRAVDRRDRWVRHGIPCSSPARTLVDLAPAVPLEALEDLLMAADAARILDRRRLDELLTERRGQPGTRRLLHLVSDDPAETRSVNERRVMAICRQFGVTRPLVNHRVHVGGRTFYADFCWPELRLVVEADSWRWHGGRLAGESDADRDQLLAVAGWRVVHFTRDQIMLGAERTGRRLVALTTPRPRGETRGS